MALQVKAIQAGSFPFQRPMKQDAQEEVSFAEWFSQQFANDTPEQQEEELPGSPMTSLEDMLLLAQEQSRILTRNKPASLSELPVNPYAQAAEIPLPQNEEELRQYVFDFFLIEPLQGGVINQKI
jgi:hypothetical protein